MTTEHSSKDEGYAIEWIEVPESPTKGHWRVFNKRTDSRIATCYLRDNAEIVCAALNRSHEPRDSLSERIGDALITGGYLDRLLDMTPEDNAERIIAAVLPKLRDALRDHQSGPGQTCLDCGLSVANCDCGPSETKTGRSFPIHKAGCHAVVGPCTCGAAKNKSGHQGEK